MPQFEKIILDIAGFLPNEDHCLHIRAKRRHITSDVKIDLITRFLLEKLPPVWM